MAFFNNELKKEVAAKPKGRPARGHIPIESMKKAGCSVCPRDKDSSLQHPKMTPQGDTRSGLYFLGNAPTNTEDHHGRLWSDDDAHEVLSKLGRSWADDSRFGNIVQCAGPALDVREIECCRGRVIADIEQSKPLIVIGLGDEVLKWATGLSGGAMTHRGTLINATFGKHTCWFYPILTPNYIHKKQRSNSTSPYEVTMRHDMDFIKDELSNGCTFPKAYTAPYDTGIEQITGQDQGDMQRLEDALHWLLSLDSFGIDYETSEISPFKQSDPKIWTAALGTFDRTIAFCVDHPDGWGTDTRMRKVRGMLGEFVYQSGRKRCHNAEFEQTWSAFMWGEQVLRRTEWEDTQAMAYALDSRKGTKSLDVQCRINFGFFLKAQSRVDVSQEGWITRHSVREVLRYNALDSKWTDLLTDVKLEQLRQRPDQMLVYERLMETIPTLVKITAHGLPVDFGYAEDYVARAAPRISELERLVRATPEVKRYSQRFGTFSLTNTDHVLTLMKDVCKRPEIMMMDWEGHVSYSTGEEQLEQIPADEVASAAMILEHRGLTRNESTYILPLLRGELTGADRMIHEGYNQMETVTSRLSSRIHNWPKRKYKDVRGCIAPGEGQWFVAADQGQIEFRVAGMLSEDQNLVKYCWTGYDVHGYWAQRIVDEFPRTKDIIVLLFGIDWDEKGMKTLRQEAKNKWVFPQLFGATTRSCAANLHLPEDIADDLGAEFWDEFPGVKRWQEKTVKFYDKHLYIETLGGFRRRGPTTLNELINMPIQGTAYEIVRAGMNALSELSDLNEDPELQPAFNGHDDLSFIISDENLEKKIQIIVREMCMPRFDYVNVPLIVEVSVGDRWHTVAEIGKYSSVDLFHLTNPYS